MRLTRLSEMALTEAYQPAGHQRRDQSRQGGRRRHREPPPRSSRAALVGRHQLHDGGRRDARAARRSGRDGRSPAADLRDVSRTSGRLRCVTCVRCDKRIWLPAFVLVACALTVALAQDAPKRRNVIIFVADGLAPRFGQPHRYAGALQSPHRRACTSPTATRCFRR